MTPSSINTPKQVNPVATQDQDTLDWKVFSELYMKERGFYPTNTSRIHLEMFHWFTYGAHSEMIGRLTPDAPK